MKTRELTMEEKEDILKLKKEGKSIRLISQELGIASTTVWNVLKKKETTGVLTTKQRSGRPRKTTAVDDRLIVKAVEQNPLTTVKSITDNLHMAGVKISRSTVKRRLREQKYRFHYVNCEPLASSVKQDEEEEEEEEDLEMADNSEIRVEVLKEEQDIELWEQTESDSKVSSNPQHDGAETNTTSKETNEESQHPNV